MKGHADRLRRSLALWQLTASGVGIVIGAGIYVLVGEAAQEAGAALWLSFAIAAILAGLTALTYCELAGMFPSAGVEFEWTSRAFNPFWGFLAGWMMVITYVVAAAAVALGFAHYLQQFVAIDERLVAIVLLFALTAVVASGIERSIWLSVVLAAVQISGLVLVIVAGAPHIGERSLVEGATTGGVLSGAALVFFAFIGFDDIATLSEETRDAATTVPRALMLTLAISGGLYVLVGLSAVSALAPDVLGTSGRPLAAVIESDWGSRASGTVTLIALAATFNTTLLVLTAASRLLYAMARAGALPPSLATGQRARSGPAGRSGGCAGGGGAIRRERWAWSRRFGDRLCRLLDVCRGESLRGRVTAAGPRRCAAISDAVLDSRDSTDASTRAGDGRSDGCVLATGGLDAWRGSARLRRAGVLAFRSI